MLQEMEEYRGHFYEYATEGKYRTAYFYKQIEPNNFELLFTRVYRGQPSEERLHAAIDEEIFDEW